MIIIIFIIALIVVISFMVWWLKFHKKVEDFPITKSCVNNSCQYNKTCNDCSNKIINQYHSTWQGQRDMIREGCYNDEKNKPKDELIVEVKGNAAFFKKRVTSAADAKNYCDEVGFDPITRDEYKQYWNDYWRFVDPSIMQTCDIGDAWWSGSTGKPAYFIPPHLNPSKDDNGNPITGACGSNNYCLASGKWATANPETEAPSLPVVCKAKLPLCPSDTQERKGLFNNKCVVKGTIGNAVFLKKKVSSQKEATNECKVLGFDPASTTEYQNYVSNNLANCPSKSETCGIGDAWWSDSANPVYFTPNDLPIPIIEGEPSTAACGQGNYCKKKTEEVKGKCVGQLNSIMSYVTCPFGSTEKKKECPKHLTEFECEKNWGCCEWQSPSPPPPGIWRTANPDKEKPVACRNTFAPTYTMNCPVKGNTCNPKQDPRSWQQPDKIRISNQMDEFVSEADQLYTDFVDKKLDTNANQDYEELEKRWMNWLIKNSNPTFIAFDYWNEKKAKVSAALIRVKQKIAYDTTNAQDFLANIDVTTPIPLLSYILNKKQVCFNRACLPYILEHGKTPSPPVDIPGGSYYFPDGIKVDTDSIIPYHGNTDSHWPGVIPVNPNFKKCMQCPEIIEHPEL